VAPQTAAEAPGGLESAAGGGGRFPSLDGVRAVAALAVVLTHVGFQTGEGVSGPARTVLSRLDIGVAVFFVLSGFLLHRPQVVAAVRGRPMPALAPYLWRRALRVLPGYWLAVAAALLLLPANDGATIGDWVRQLTLTQVYGDRVLLPGLTQMWSLATEVTFYLALPVLGRLAGRTLRSQLVLCGAMVGTTLAWQALIGHGVLPPYAGYWLPGHADWFALGMAMAAVSVAAKDRFETLARDGVTCWVGAGALFVVAGTPLTGPYGLALLSTSEALWRTLLYGAASVLLVLPATLPDARGPVATFLATPPMAFLGRISYGIFLLHLTVLTLVFQGLDVPVFTGHFWRVLAWTVPLSLLVAWASLRAVEEPVLRLKNRGPGAARRTRRAAAPVATR
jgi:peptidoglycan/LPS O-acetylase OafA/YrhL